jgi:2-polyprenyl-3-methyl-5-hydroxy-6-metoxy-1,4-benzoquinol methylase
VAAALRPCPLCSSQQHSPVFLTICQCRQCGFCYVNPLGSLARENQSEEYFLNDYLPLHQSNWKNSMAERRDHLAMIRQRFRLPHEPELLDVGCALGFMLQEAKAAGWNAAGVETSPFAANYAAERTGCPVFTGTLQQAKFKSGSFDVVTLTDVIEHVADPRELMSEVYRVLRPRGVVFMVTPNFSSMFVKLFRDSAYSIGPDEHISYFQPNTIARLLRTAGFARVVTGSKDLYAENLKRLLRRERKSAAQSDIKAAFGGHSSLRSLRRVANKIFMHLRIGDKLIALGQK